MEKKTSKITTGVKKIIKDVRSIWKPEKASDVKKNIKDVHSPLKPNKAK